MKNKFTAGIFGITALFLAVFLIPETTLAAQPTLVLSNQGNNSVLVSSYGDQNAAVTLYYANSGNGSYTSAGSIGWTNQSGTFSTTLNYNSYNIASGAAVYVVVNGQQSPTTYWPSNNNCYNYNCNGNNYGNISLSQTNLSLTQGQTSSVTIYNNSNNSYYNNSYYVSNNSNSNIADVTVSGSLITVRANNPGSATFSICGYNNSGCTTLYVTVAQNYNNNNGYYNGYQYVYLNPTSNGYYGNNALIFQPSVVTIARNQTMSYTMSAQSYNSYYPTTNTYYVTSNTKPTIASVLVSNNNLFIQGLKKGTTAATVCRNAGYCGTLTLTVQ